MLRYNFSDVQFSTDGITLAQPRVEKLVELKARIPVYHWVQHWILVDTGLISGYVADGPPRHELKEVRPMVLGQRWEPV